MDPVRSARLVRRNRFRPARRRWACTPMLFDALEERMLLSVAPLKDINPVNMGPNEITGAGGKVYFVATDADGGADLDVLNGSSVTVLKSVPAPIGNYGPAEAISYLTPAGSKLFFMIEGGNGSELWATDGTVAGTAKIELKSGTQNVSLSYGLTAAGSRVYFTAYVGSGENTVSELFMSDGTTAGTVPVPPPAGSTGTTVNAENLVGHDGALYFSSNGQLLKTDGGVTRLIEKFTSSSAYFLPSISNLTDAGASLYFTATDASGNGLSLYVSDGTASGTKLLKDFKQPSGSDTSYNGLVGNLVPAGNKLYFIGNDTAHGPSLWVSDGTAKGTTFVKSFGSRPSSANYASGLFNTPITTMRAAGTKLFLVAEAPSAVGSGLTLWVSNGTATGTTKLAGITPAQIAAGSGTRPVPGQFTTANGILYFANNDSKHGVELWRSDGTAAGTRMVRDLKAGAGGSYPGNMSVVGNTLYFSASTTAGASELWSSDGTAAGTIKAATVSPQDNGSGVSRPYGASFGQLGSTIIFSANDGVHGTALWKTNGTAAGTTMLKVLNPNGYNYAPANFTTVGKTLYFVTRQEDPKTHAATETLWKTNGTADGTTRVVTDGKSIVNTVAFNGKLAFLETNADGSGLTLWLSDGTAHGTKRVRGFTNLAGSYSTSTRSAMSVTQGKLYLIAPLSVDGGYASESLWVSDGTAKGTKPVLPKPSFSDVEYVTPFQGKLYFTVNSPQPALWSTNGTSAGTKLVAKLGASSTSVDGMVGSGPNLYIFTSFRDTDYNTTAQLFRSNGTAKGTAVLHTFAKTYSLSGASLPNGKLALTALNEDTFDNDLWITDGTKAGTVQVPNVQLSYAGTFVTIGGQVYAQGEDDAHGAELWRTDGTIAGTTLVQDINPGPNSSNPYVLGAINGRLIVVADDGLHGNEIFSIVLPKQGTKHAKTH